MLKAFHPVRLAFLAGTLVAFYGAMAVNAIPRSTEAIGSIERAQMERVRAMYE